MSADDPPPTGPTSGSATATTAETDGASDDVRPFTEGDEDAVRSLLAPEDGPAPTPAWFDWCFRTNPAIDHVPIFVAERGDRIVSVRPFVPIRVRAGDVDGLAVLCLAPGTAPAHADRDLPARTLRAATDHFARQAPDRRSAFFVTAAEESERKREEHDDAAEVGAGAGADSVAETDADSVAGTDADSEAGDAPLDWRYGDERVRWQRVQRAGAFLARRIPGPPGRTLGATVTAVTGRVRRLRDRRAAFDTAPYRVQRHSEVPDATLTACYESAIPASTHVVYDRPFVRWHLAEPGNDPAATYVVYQGSRVVAALVAHRGNARDLDVVTISHVLPITGGPDRPDAIAAAMEQLLAEHADAAVVRTANPLLPDAVASAYGFGADDHVPSSLFATHTGRAMGFAAPGVDGLVGRRPVTESEPFLWPLANPV